MELLFALCEIEIHEFRRAASQNVHRLLWVSSFHREAEIYDEIFEPQIDGGDFEIDEGFCAAIIISRIIGIAARGNWLLDQISTVYAYPPFLHWNVVANIIANLLFMQIELDKSVVFPLSTYFIAIASFMCFLCILFAVKANLIDATVIKLLVPVIRRSYGVMIIAIGL